MSRCEALRLMAAPVSSMSQVQACQRRVAELRGNLAILAERCGSLEQVHEGAIERLRSFSSASSAKTAPLHLTAEQLKKQSTAKVRGFQNRHSDLMKSLQQITESQAESWEGLKKHNVMGPADSPSSDAKNSLAKSPPSTLQKQEMSRELGNSHVQVMSLDGPAAKLNSRLRGRART